MAQEPDSRKAAASTRGKQIGLIILSIVWLILVTSLTVGMINYANSPGKGPKPPKKWPKNIQLALFEDQSTIMLFAHPHCPCTKATLGELEEIMARCQSLASAYVVLIWPVETGRDWVQTDIKNIASIIPDVEVIIDSAGQLTRAFNCETSGSTLLYNETGTLVFHGGITPSRGHMGDNVGRDVIEDFLQGRDIFANTSPVFGCGLFDSICTMGDVN
ncbi:MAG TPA: hypothetical protein VHP63_07415 [candidate division Zixibacteria bacterium]|nr:hypothetical protein [candidate division Zixibacteria bacterium]